MVYTQFRSLITDFFKCENMDVKGYYNAKDEEYDNVYI